MTEDVEAVEAAVEAVWPCCPVCGSALERPKAARTPNRERFTVQCVTCPGKLRLRCVFWRAQVGEAA